MDCLFEWDQCSKRKLEIGQEAEWLLKAFSKTYKISQEYRQLMHLAWIFKSVLPNALAKDCLQNPIGHTFARLLEIHSTKVPSHSAKYDGYDRLPFTRHLFLPGASQMDPMLSFSKKVSAKIEVGKSFIF